MGNLTIGVERIEATSASKGTNNITD